MVVERSVSLPPYGLEALVVVDDPRLSVSATLEPSLSPVSSRTPITTAPTRTTTALIATMTFSRLDCPEGGGGAPMTSGATSDLPGTPATILAPSTHWSSAMSIC